MKCLSCGFEIKKSNKSRSNPQNDYFHGVLLPILANYTGYSADEMKAVMKWKFRVKSTAALTTAEFEKFMSDIRAWASSDLEVYIPCPNEKTEN